MDIAHDRLRGLHDRLRRAHATQLTQAQRRAEALAMRLRLARPTQAMRQATLSRLAEQLRHAMHARLDHARQRAHLGATQLAQLDPTAVLARGFSIVRDTEGRIVRDAAALMHSQPLRIDFARGHADVEVSHSYPDSDAAD